MCVYTHTYVCVCMYVCTYVFFEFRCIYRPQRSIVGAAARICTHRRAEKPKHQAREGNAQQEHCRQAQPSAKPEPSKARGVRQDNARTKILGRRTQCTKSSRSSASFGLMPMFPMQGHPAASVLPLGLWGTDAALKAWISPTERSHPPHNGRPEAVEPSCLQVRLLPLRARAAPPASRPRRGPACSARAAARAWPPLLPREVSSPRYVFTARAPSEDGGSRALSPRAPSPAAGPRRASP